MKRDWLDELAVQTWRKMETSFGATGSMAAYLILQRALCNAAGLTIVTMADYVSAAKERMELIEKQKSMTSDNPEWEEIANRVMDLSREMAEYTAHRMG